jgi:DNA-damage-inducible protein D
MEDQNRIIVFQEKGIRRIWHNEEWYFSIVDVIEVLTNSPIPRTYWSKLKARILVESELNPNWVQLKMMSADGKNYKTDATNTEGMFRIIQSITSPKAEPFKQWLAKVGYERVQEIENPELAAQRARKYYKDLGYNDAWIETRLKSVEIREQLTDEWKNRGVQEGMEYSILTAEISRATFGLTPTEYKEVKGLKRENLRDHMTDIELIFTMLGEATTRNKAVDKDAQGFDENKEAARAGGKAAGKARGAYEEETGDKVVSPSNFKGQIADAKKKALGNSKKSNDKEN